MMSLDSLTDMTVLVRVVAAGSLSAAARELDLSLAVVSKRLARLEQQLGVRLIHRTTRRLTEEGRDFHDRVTRILADVEAAQESVGERGRKAAGLLRVSVTAAFARRQIAPRLARFNALYPEVRVHVLASDSIVDLVQHRIDLAIRQAVLEESNLIVTRLAPNHRVACASPDYLAERGRPDRPEDLLHHRCVVFGDPPMDAWRFEAERKKPIVVCVRGSVLANDGEVAHAAALAGSGIVLKSIWDVADDLDAGRLIRVLPGYRAPAAPIQAVYPTSRHRPAKLRVFLEFLSSELRAAYPSGEHSGA